MEKKGSMQVEVFASVTVNGEGMRRRIGSTSISRIAGVTILRIVLSAGGTTFIGPGRSTLGFDSFLDGGMAFKADISRLGYVVKSLSLGGKLIKGGNVTGWSVIFDYEF